MRLVPGLMLIVVLHTVVQGAVAAEEGTLTGMIGAHNTVRAGLGLPEVAWSDELAEFAREWAQYLSDHNRCRLKHRPHEGKDAPRYGENLYWAGAVQLSTGARAAQRITPHHVVSAWVSESQHYNHEKNRCRWGRKCGHYTQVVWKNTRRIGCGMAACPDQGQIWVCNYDPPGNYAGQKPY